MEYIATFYSHYGAMKFKKDIEKAGGLATLMPVPRTLSSSCGTCVKFSGENENSFPYEEFITDETEQVVRVEGPSSYVSLYKTED